MIKALMTPDGPIIACSGSSQSLYTLSALSTFSWHAMPIQSASIENEGLWTRSSFELALNRWLNTFEGRIEDSSMLLFHLSSILLHTNMANIHGIVHNHLHGKPFTSIPEAMKQWLYSDHCKVAVLHANEIHQVAQRIVISQRTKRFMKSPSAGARDFPSTADEGPHEAICLYLAVLVLWATEIISDPIDGVAAKGILEKGCNILSQFSIRIATVLINVLRSLEQKMA
jgi:hypothetical protein